MTKNTLKYLGAAGLIVLIGLTALYFVRYLQYKNSPERQREEFVKTWEKAYREDTYGGITPEETLQLFIDALKKGDTDLAAKYFIVDEQEKWQKNLKRIKDENLLILMIKDLEELEKDKSDTNEVFFISTNEKNEVKLQMIIAKSPYNKKWKIYEL